MTAEPPPPFDLYRELEVSRRASAAVIEAAYRSLVRRQDADSSGSTDGDRVQRLNTARAWLTDPVRRSRYDAATSPKAAVGSGASPSPTSRATSRPPDGPSRTWPRPESSETPARSFGPNAAEVRLFLADLRGLDWERALRVFERRTVADAGDYENARRAVEAIARTKRLEPWLFAREAASVIVRGELGVSAATDQVLHVVVDAVGAIAIRDLVPPSVLDVLLLPWSRGDEPVPGQTSSAPGAANAEPGVMPPAPATTSPPPAPPAVEEPAIRAAPASGNVDPAPRRTRLGRRRLPVPAWFAASFAIVALIIVGSGIGSLDQPEASLAAVGATEGHSSGPASTPAAQESLPRATANPTLPPASPSTVETDQPTSPPGNVAVAPTPGPAPTPRPRQTPSPAGTTVPEGTPGPAPTAAPTAAPTPTCTVPSLIDVQSFLAQRDWRAAGFSGTVVLSPVVPPHYEIKSQSLPAGSSVACTSGITVTD